jgi:DNA polymerase I-like protein with 3'-5' exonuclease and polymerase domains/uracil-DNA glycosylase
MGFDKANCASCPLRKYWQAEGRWERVDFLHNDSPVLILGDAPSKQASAMGRAWADTHGVEMKDALESACVKPHNVDYGYVVGCRWPKDDPRMFLQVLKKRNRRLASKGRTLEISPIEACRGHVAEEMAKYKTVITCGPMAAKSVLAGNPSLEAVRGGPTVVDGRKVLPTYHPSQVALQRHLRPVLHSDIQKAIRHHRDRLQWPEPIVHYNPTPDVVKDFFHRAGEEDWLLSYDVETDGIDALNAGLRCIGIGTENEVLMLGFLSIDGVSRFYSPSDEEEIKRLLREVFDERSKVRICGHNAGYFDRLVVEQHLGVTPAPLVDTLLLHKLGASEYRHSLGFVGSVLTDVPAWKADHAGVTAKTDKELHEYCATDVAVTARVVQPLLEMVYDRKQTHLIDKDLRMQSLCAGMRRMGIRIHEPTRLLHEEAQTEAAVKWRTKLQRIQPDINPNSTAQLRRLLFDKWALPPHEYTLSGEPSTSVASLRALSVNPLADDEQREFLQALRFYRRAEKLLSTYIRKFAPTAGVVKDGYVYPDYNSHGTVTGRLSSSNPNFQNIPFNLRDMFIPPDGCVFVGADYDQLELRFAAALANAKHYLNAFEKKQIDPHNLTADLMFGEVFWNAEGAPDTKMGKGKGQFKQLRNLAKTICFASLYGASAPKVHEIIGRAEDDAGNMLYAHYDLRQIRVLHRRWKSKAPEFEQWWKNTVDQYKMDGYIEEVVWMRRRYFAEEDYNAILNFGVQAGGFAVVAMSMLELVEKHIPFDFDNKIGLVNQLHDAVLLSVPEERAEEVKQIVDETLTRRVDGLDVTFSAEAEIGMTWKDV